MADKVKPLGMESTTGGGGDNFPFPTELDPTEDYVAAKGLAFENNDNRLIDLNVSGQIQFKDAVETSYINVTALRTASSNIFSPVDDIAAANVQDAIREANIFGSYMAYDIDTSETSTSSTTTYSTKLSATTPSLPSGNYRIGWRFKWYAGNANRGLQCRVQEDGTDIANFIEFTANVNARLNAGGFVIRESISGVKTYTLDFRVGIGSTTVYVSEAYLEVWRIS